MLLTKKRKLLEDTDAVSSMIEFILVSSIALLFFVMVTLYFTPLLLEGSQQTVAMERFGDIGNDISTKMVDIYIIAPENGSLSTDLTMPTSVGGHEYMVNADVSNLDQMITVSSLKESTLEVSVTINGIAQTVAINGSTLSGSSEHKLSYSSNV